jgi:hypothetical protein
MAENGETLHHVENAYVVLIPKVHLAYPTVLSVGNTDKCHLNTTLEDK